MKLIEETRKSSYLDYQKSAKFKYKCLKNAGQELWDILCSIFLLLWELGFIAISRLHKLMQRTIFAKTLDSRG